MEGNDAVFEEETRLDPSLRMRSRARHGDVKDQHSRTTTQDEEQSPLLGDHEDLADDAEAGDGGFEGGDDGITWPGSTDFDDLPWYKRPSIFWIMPPFLMYALAFGGIIVPKLDLILQLNCREYFADRAMHDPSFHLMPVILGNENPQCDIPEVQAIVARFTLYLNLTAGLLSAITSPKLGALSDRYGRRKILLVTAVGLCLSEVITIICATNPDTVSVNWILVGYVFDGITGSFIAGMAVVNSYATDCTPPSKRGEIFGYFHGCLFIGVALGPLAAGYIIKATGEILTIFYITLGAHVLFMFVIMFVVPESLSRRRQEAARERHRVTTLDRLELELSRAGDGSIPKPNAIIKAIKNANLLAPLTILCPTGEGSSNKLRRNLLLLAAVDTTTFGVAMGSMTVVVIYSKYMFGWDTTAMSTFVSIVNSGRVGMLIIVLPLITRIFRGRRTAGIQQRNTGSDTLDLVLIRVAIFFDMLGYLGYTLARTGPLFILSGVVASTGGIGSATIQSSLTKHVPRDRTGQLLGAMGLLHALARVVAPTIFNLIYSLTVGKFTQTTFVCLTVAFGVAFVMSCFIKPHVYLNERDATWPARPSPEVHDDTVDR